MDTKNCNFLKGVTFSNPSFWVSMLVFGNVIAMSSQKYPSRNANMTSPKLFYFDGEIVKVKYISKKNPSKP